mgnify:CR=1 FL=1
MKKLKKVAATIVAVLAAMSATALTACSKSRDGSHIVFCSYGDESELAIYTEMVDEFNKTYGAEHNIKVDHTPIGITGYNNYIQSMSTARNSYDVCVVIEDRFKAWATTGIIGPMEEYFNAVTDIDVSDVFPNTVNRLRLNVSNNTSNLSDPLYGMPLDTKPSALYYNESMFNKAGIIIISVDEEDMDAWNRGEIADKRGHKKSDFAKLSNVTVPKKGYYRSVRPYVSGFEWTMPASDEILVFNNRIPMNWDEMEDLAMIFSPSSNPNAGKDFGTDYGMFTEWWFNYGWAVGGNCLQDLSGDGEWNFSLLDSTPNYIVTGESYTGKWSGKVYNTGETLEHNDKFDLPVGKVMTPDNNGGYTLDGNKLGIRADVTAAATDGTLGELPSTRDAFTRYLRLGASKTSVIENAGGLDIAPNPIIFNTRTRQNYWYSGKMAMLVDYSTYIENFSKQATIYNFEWDVAPLIVYKEYTEPMNPNCDTVKIQGKEAGECNSKAMCVRARTSTQVKESAAKFIKWMASKEGQSLRAEKGHFPNQQELLDSIKYNGYAPKNITVFSENLQYQSAGDWWYLPDDMWIKTWATPLNSKVRNGTLTYDLWKKDAIPDTNEYLKKY